MMLPSRNLYPFSAIVHKAAITHLPPSPPVNSPPSPVKSPGGRLKTNDRLKELMVCWRNLDKPEGLLYYFIQHIHVPESPFEGPSVFNIKLFDEDIEVRQPRKAGQLRREDGTTEECSEMRLPLKYGRQTVLFVSL
jgi:hypothetical protein